MPSGTLGKSAGEDAYATRFMEGLKEEQGAEPREAAVDGRAEQNAFRSCERLPSLTEAVEQLVAEAMRRSDNNQTMASRILGISQPALSKRLKQRR